MKIFGIVAASTLAALLAAGSCSDLIGADKDTPTVVVPTSVAMTKDMAAPKTLTMSGPTACVAADTVVYTTVAKDQRGRIVLPTLAWSSTNASVAPIVYVSPDHSIAKILCVKAGSSTVKAAWNTLSATKSLTVAGTPTPPDSQPVVPAACSKLSDWTAHPQMTLAKPGYLMIATDTIYHTTITRISGDPGTPIGGGVSGYWPTTVKQNYPKDPVWTADGALMVLKDMSGVPSPGAALFLDGTTYAVQFSRSGPAGGGEWRLHPTKPDTAVVLNSDGHVSFWNVRTNVTTTKVPAVSGYSSNELGPNEGGLSYDGHYIVAKAVRNIDGHVVGRVINVDSATTGPVIDLTGAGVTTLDWVSISAGDGYVVAFGTISGTSQATKVWNRQTGALVQSWTDQKFGHADLGIDSVGNEVEFGAVASGTLAKHWIARRLSTGAITDLTPSAITSFSWHTSTRNNLRHGWGYGDTNDITGTVTDGEIYAISLDGAQAIERWGKHRAVGNTYDDDPHPVPSPDGKRIAFSSNWTVSGGPIQAYVMGCP